MVMPGFVQNIEPEVLEELVELKQNHRFRLLQEQIHEAREAYYANFARSLSASGNPVDQREIDRKRGFWDGAVWALRDFPAMTEAQWKRFIEEDEEEAEES